MSTSYASALREALFDPDPNSSVRRTKELVGRELLDVDPRIDIKNTEYFNHTFSPDFVLSWPESGRTQKRFVFLRLPGEPKYFVEEVQEIANLHPIVFGLEGDNRLDESIASVQDLSYESDTLVTDVHGINRLAQNRQERSIANLVSSALLRGGRGVINSSEANNISTSVTQGFDAARRAEPGPTELAVETFSRHLAPGKSRQMTQFLQAVWISSHGRIEGFPGPRDLSGDISDESLEYLLHFEPISDPEFWRALGASVTVDQISRLEVSGYHENLQSLIQSNLDRLWSRNLRLHSGQLPTTTGGRSPFWSVSRQALALHGDDYIAYFAQTSADLKHIKTDRGHGLSVADIRQRAQDIHVSELTLRGGSESLTVEAQGRQSVLETRTFSSLPESVLVPSRVTKATSNTPSGQEIHCDFVERDARAVTSARISLEDWLLAALPLLWPISSSELPRLANSFRAISQEALAFVESDQLPGMQAEVDE
jgi:hypothetical protein